MRYLTAGLIAVGAIVSSASADFFFSSPTTDVPILLEKYPGSDKLLNYEFYFDFTLPSGVSLQTPEATETLNLRGGSGSFSAMTGIGGSALVTAGSAETSSPET
ncbi:MAG: hypothetical protein KDB27_36590, partial [Planctomycetales bacterium]|nr:hypothetical protein [Planctomycetales bacterium]